MFVDQLLHHPWGLVRKGAFAFLSIPRFFARMHSSVEALAANPPILANSFPKSGTHLLEQALGGLPERRNYGVFLSSMSSSRRFREQSIVSMRRKVCKIVPGEMVRGHLAYDSALEWDLAERRVIHFMIYRDPRDIVVSEAHYLRSMNRWHRLHPIFSRFASVNQAITASIEGLNKQQRALYYPNIAERFAAYYPWIDRPSVCAVRFEDLQGGRRRNTLWRMAEFYAMHVPSGVNLEQLVDAMEGAIDPTRSHTFRKGGSGGWRAAFTDEHRELFESIGGDLLERLGYERDSIDRPLCDAANSKSATEID